MFKEMNDITVYSSKNRMSDNVFIVFFSLMEEAFPSSERRTAQGHRAEFNSPMFNSICYMPDRIYGFINYWEFEDFVYVEHFAVQPELRGKGIGASLMEELRCRVGNKILVLEAEPPQDSDIARRRICFYERLGFMLNPYEYIQPAMSKGEQPIPLVIMSSPKALTEKEYSTIRDTIYLYVYSPAYFF